MTIGELREMIRELDDDDSIMIEVPYKRSSLLYSKFSLGEDKFYKVYKLIVHANY